MEKKDSSKNAYQLDKNSNTLIEKPPSNEEKSYFNSSASDDGVLFMYADELMKSCQDKKSGSPGSNTKKTANYVSTSLGIFGAIVMMFII